MITWEEIVAARQAIPPRGFQLPGEVTTWDLADRNFVRLLRRYRREHGQPWLHPEGLNYQRLEETEASRLIP